MTDWTRPVLSELPARNYQDNPIVDHLTKWTDEVYAEKALQLQNFYQVLNPLTCPSEFLDYLAFLCGMSGNYWVNTWTDAVKRKMISNSHFLWENRGTLTAIRTVLDIHFKESFVDEDGDADDLLTNNVSGYSIWINGALIITFEISDIFGKNDMRLYVRLPLIYQKASRQFKEAERTLRNYAPAIIDAQVVFDAFYLGFSELGDPVFTSAEQELLG